MVPIKELIVQARELPHQDLQTLSLPRLSALLLCCLPSVTPYNHFFWPTCFSVAFVLLYIPSLTKPLERCLNLMLLLLACICAADPVWRKQTTTLTSFKFMTVNFKWPRYVSPPFTLLLSQKTVSYCFLSLLKCPASLPHPHFQLVTLLYNLIEKLKWGENFADFPHLPSYTCTCCHTLCLFLFSHLWKQACYYLKPFF